MARRRTDRRGAVPRRRDAAGNPLGAIGRALGLTVASAAVWGVAHVSSGRRAVGYVLMSAFASLIVGIGVLAIAFQKELQQIVVQHAWLNAITVAIVVLAMVWATIVIRSYQIVQPPWVPAGMRVTAGGLVVILAVGVCTPLVWAARDTYILRDTIGQIFPDSGPKIDADNPWKNKPRVNILMLGGDGGADRSGIRTDSITLASVDTKTGNAMLISLPRQLQKFSMPPEFRQRFPQGFTGEPGEPASSAGLLNSVYIYGEHHPELLPGVKKARRGPEMTKRVVGHLLGQRIDYYVLVNLAGFKDIVNAIGGVKVRIPKRIPIGGDDTRPPTGWLEPGYRKLDGEHALWFGRSRHGDADGDFSRMGRQKCLMKAIAEQADPQKVLTRFEKLAAAAKKTIYTNIPAALLPALVTLSDKAKHGSRMDSLLFNPDKIPGFHVYQPDITVMRQVTAKAIAESGQPKPTPSASATRKRKKPAKKAGAENLNDLCK